MKAKEKKFNWTAPWPWSPRTRELRIGRTFIAWIHPAMGGGLFAKINGRQLKPVFHTLPEAKKAVEAKIVRQLEYAYKQVMQ